MKSIKLIKTVNGKSKTVDMSENIWKTILSTPELVPKGITYELAATKPIEVIELMDTPIEVEINEEFEPVEVFKKEELEHESKEIDNGVETDEKRKKAAPKKQANKNKR
jgi:hypothetical protein